MLKARSASNLLWVLTAGVLLAAADATAYRSSKRPGLAALAREAHPRRDPFAAAIDSTVNRHSHSPVTPRLNPDVLELAVQLGAPSLQTKASRTLKVQVTRPMEGDECFKRRSHFA